MAKESQLSKRFTIRVGRKPQRAKSVQSQRAKRASTLHAAKLIQASAHANVNGSGHSPSASATTPVRVHSPVPAEPTPSAVAPHPTATMASSPAPAQLPTVTLAPPLPAKKGGLFKRLAARFKPAAPASPASQNRPDATNGEFTDREARMAALRARGLLPPQDLSEQEAIRDRHMAVVATEPEPIADEGPSAAKDIVEQWKRRHSLAPPREGEEDESKTSMDYTPIQREPVLVSLPPPPRRRFSASISPPPVASGSGSSSDPRSDVQLPTLPTPPGSATFGVFPPNSAASHDSFRTASESPSASPSTLDITTPRAVTPSTPRRAHVPPPIVFSPSKPTFDLGPGPLSPTRVPLPPSPSPSLGSFGAFGDMDMFEMMTATTGPSPTSSPNLLDPSSAFNGNGTPSRNRSNTGGTVATLPSLSSAGDTADESHVPSTPRTGNESLSGTPPMPFMLHIPQQSHIPVSISAPVFGSDIIVEEPTALPMVREADADDDDDESDVVAPLPSTPLKNRSFADMSPAAKSISTSTTSTSNTSARSPSTATFPVSPTASSTLAPVPTSSRRKSTLNLAGLGRRFTNRRQRTTTLPLPKSPTSPTLRTSTSHSFGSSGDGNGNGGYGGNGGNGAALSRGVSTRLATTRLHDRGSIYVQTNAIKDDEERRLAEVAFLM